MFEIPNDLVEWLKQVLPIISNHVVDKVEVSLPEYDVKMYWAGTIIRIDLKPIK